MQADLHRWARIIDHTFLKVASRDYSQAQVEANFNTFLRFDPKLAPYALCVREQRVPTLREVLQSSGPVICSVLGFPDGDRDTTETKIAKAHELFALGAAEIDTVFPIKLYRADPKSAREQIEKLFECAKEAQEKVIKVILENYYLEEFEILAISEIILQAAQETGTTKGRFLKTSTGFANPEEGPRKDGLTGARVRDFALMREASQGFLGLKASGGVKTLKEAHKFQQIADPKQTFDPMIFRIGTSGLLDQLASMLGPVEASQNSGQHVS